MLRRADPLRFALLGANESGNGKEFPLYWISRRSA